MSNSGFMAKAKTLMGQYVPHLCLVLCLVTVIVIAFNVDGQGYVPSDDCLRHCAKAVSGKAWDEILLLRPDYTGDHNHGWHKTLEFWYKQTNTDMSGLVSFSVISLFLSVSIPLLLYMKRPEAWICALMLFGILFFGDMYRLFYGRPYVFAIGGTLLLLELWRSSEKKRPYGLIIFSTLLFSAMTYLHGSFYLYIIPIGVFFLAGQWRKFFWLLPCLVIGVFLGVVATGEPLEFIQCHLTQIDAVTKEGLAKRYLVTELRPKALPTSVMFTIGALFVFRHLWKGNSSVIIKSPVFILVISMGLLGFYNARFWLDFGAPALLLLIAVEVHEFFVSVFKENSFRRLILTLCLCASFFIVFSANVSDRWDNNYEGCGRRFPKAEDEFLQGWFPENGGVFYNTTMTFFYNTFVANPHADWKYALGFDPNIMPPENLEAYREFQRLHKWEHFNPWVDQMTSKDRLVLHCGKEPEIDRLEWKEAFPGMWFGRIPWEVDDLKGGRDAINQ